MYLSKEPEWWIIVPHPQVGNYVIAPGNYVIVTTIELGNSVIADTPARIGAMT